jgi:hypothetical protein
MLNAALRQMNKTVLADLAEVSGSENDNNNCISREDVNSEEGDREWRTPCSSVDGYRVEGTGYHTPAYLSPGITRKLTLTEEKELPFLSARC